MIDLNKLFAEGADEESIVAAMRKNKEEQEAVKRAEQKKEETENFCREARAHLINALLAYDDAFHIFGDEPVTNEDIEALEETIKGLEKMIPAMIKLEKFKRENPVTFDDLDKMLDSFGF